MNKRNKKGPTAVEEVQVKTASSIIVEESPLPLVPQVQVINGSIVVNQASLTVTALSAPIVDRERIVESAHDFKVTTSSSFTNNKPVKRWTDNDTELFYKGISSFGLSPEMIAQFFPSRNTKQVVAKLIREQKVNPLRIEQALSNRVVVDATKYLAQVNETLALQKAQKVRDEGVK